jgi:hypothetical protein
MNGQSFSVNVVLMYLCATHDPPDDQSSAAFLWPVPVTNDLACSPDEAHQEYPTLPVLPPLQRRFGHISLFAGTPLTYPQASDTPKPYVLVGPKRHPKCTRPTGSGESRVSVENTSGEGCFELVECLIRRSFARVRCKWPSGMKSALALRRSVDAQRIPNLWRRFHSASKLLP